MLLIFVAKLVPWKRKLGNDSQLPWLVHQFHTYGTFLRAYLKRGQNVHLSMPLNLLLRRLNWRQNLVLEYRPKTTCLPVVGARFLLAANLLPLNTVCCCTLCEYRVESQVTACNHMRREHFLITLGCLYCVHRVRSSVAWICHMKNVHKHLPQYHGMAALAEVMLEEAKEVMSVISQTS